jgi:hypothetical protein
MPCWKPIIVDPAADDPNQFGHVVECGRCKPCRIKRKLSWVGRLRLELASASEVGRFVTLTYAGDTSPHLQPQHLTDWLKRYRYHHGPFRYYAAGEYGEETHRPHWHVLMFGVQQRYPKNYIIPDKEIHWGHGFARDGDATKDSIGYCAGYCLKLPPPGFDNVTRQSLKPGLGFPQFSAFASTLAGYYRLSPPSGWPTAYTFRGKRYPLWSNARTKFIQLYLKAGGLPPVSKNPDHERQIAQLALKMGGSSFEQSEATRALFTNFTESKQSRGAI